MDHVHYIQASYSPVKSKSRWHMSQLSTYINTRIDISTFSVLSYEQHRISPSGGSTRGDGDRLGDQTGTLHQPAARRTHCREILFTVRCRLVVQGPASFQGRVNFFVRGLQPRNYIPECPWLFRVVLSGRSKGVPLSVGFSWDVWQGSWDPQNCPNFHLWEIPV